MSAPTVTRLAESDWRVFAALRLRALLDTLGTADQQYRQEIEFSASQWRRRLRAHAQFAMRIDDRLVGLIGAQRQSVTTVYLYSLWLEPDVRGRGLGHRLVTAAIDWARSQRVREVTLRVEAANATARGVYEELGFGVVEVSTGAPRDEITMSLKVG
ncbi:GNAT family N-acetyltransferase [Mycolicibacterium sp. 050158]|jgi:GNAT superfamily N-acetyltransferase|uniref:GNAT family N-acetyltransferase n=1 Tax=Mycolicibacterium sp. 050158 TaxID=3090602 RepID=UPI00299E1821|nr:GNAT family N-acetyltransferase [Mycolicibacterium sp. 050158]MDX1890949.1 GNAT family N-acetyltransferase [Mycolicibacterium sp. 050158]